MITMAEIETVTWYLATAVGRMAQAEAALSGGNAHDIADAFMAEYEATKDRNFEEWKREKYGDKA
jgi:hypothetical protein